MNDFTVEQRNYSRKNKGAERLNQVNMFNANRLISLKRWT